MTLVLVHPAALAQRVLSRPLAAPAGTQADLGSQRASATATLPGTRTAAQLAPATARTPTAGDFTAGASAVGADAPRKEGRHGSPASAAASQPVPVMEMQRDGTLMFRGDPTQLQERLRQGGVGRLLRRKGGVLVGLDQVGKARQLLLQPPPRTSASAGPSLPSLPSLPGQQFSRSAPDQNSKAKDFLSHAPRVTSLATLANSAGANFERIVTQVPGLVVLRADALHPDSLGSTLDSVAATFSGGRYATMDLLEDLVLYRAWTPGQSREFGGFWSLDKPVGSLQTRIDSALLPEWGVLRGTGFRSQATDFTTIKVPAGTRVHAGEVGSQGGQWVGGGSQILIEGGPQEVWKIDGGKLR